MSMPNPNRPLVGVDTGGTFTDFAVWRDGRLETAKVLSTPDDPARAICEGLERLGLLDEEIDLVHGTTVGTNAVLEGRGARVAFITNRGFGDLLTLARQNRDALYDLHQPPVDPPVPAELCLETGGRATAGGEMLEPLSDDDLSRLAAEIDELAPEAVAVNLLFSFLHPELEQRIRSALPGHLPVSLSSEVLPEIREYERGIATWLNAAVGPRLGGYLRRLARRVPRARIGVMQSDGTTVAGEQAAGRAVHLLLSGPAGGLAAALEIGRATGIDRLLSFDMGGTSTDVALVAGKSALTREGRIGRYPVPVPMVDIHTIGAGGGSIAWVDAGGLLQVGPRSAGADPGPVCYGQGGTEPTVTDANVYLGRLPPQVRLGGRMALDRAAAAGALEKLAKKLDIGTDAAARGIIEVAVEHMSRALRVMSAERGIDPAGLTLMAFGGAAGLHVCDLAESLSMQRALVPARGGVLSALGMLVAEPGRQAVRSLLKAADRCTGEMLAEGFEALESRMRRELSDEDIDPGSLLAVRQVECRYRGQDATMLVDADVPEAMAERFQLLHERQFGYRLDMPVELVNLRAEMRGVPRLKGVPSTTRGERQAPAESGVAGCDRPVPVFQRAGLMPGERHSGPVIVLDENATMWVPAGWTAELTDDGHLVLEC